MSVSTEHQEFSIALALMAGVVGVSDYWFVGGWSVTVGDMLDRQKGFGAGFDFLRVFLSIMVVFVHSFLVVSGDSNFPIIWFANYWVLAVFFGLSGFLITGSAMRLNLANFLTNRGIRIFPALAVEIVLAVVLLGPLFTTIDFPAYFSNCLTAYYLTNIVGLVNYHLPGVFETHPSPRVNTSLWTVPFEIACYVIMSGLIIFGLLRRPRLIAVAAAGFVAAGLIIVYVVPVDSYLPGRRLLNFFLVDRGSKLFVGFLIGVLLYLYRRKVPYSRPLFFACLVYSAAFSLLPSGDWANVPLLNLLTIAPLSYVMIFIGVSDMPKLPFFSGGDYSYGIYLYGFPLQQALYALFRPDHPLLMFAMCLPPILLVAYVSWHYVEKPLVKMRRKFSFSAKERLAAGGSL